MTRPQAKTVEFAVALMAALGTCMFALQVDVRSALEGLWSARGTDAQYTVTVLGGRGLWDIADIGNSGYLVGMAPDVNTDRRATLWREGRVVFIDRSNCDYSRASAISSTNCVVFYVDTEQGVPGCRSYIWREPGPALPITRPAREDRYCKATAINSAGDVVGVIGGPDEACHAFLWREDSGAVVIDSRPSYAAAINDRGQIAGWWSDRQGLKRACVWLQGSDGYYAIDLVRESAGRAEACGINNDGLVVGWGTYVGAFKWTAEDGLHTLPGLPAQTCSMALDVNASGDITGRIIAKGQPRAVLWRGEGVVDLNASINPESGCELVSAQAINDDGVIACLATLADSSDCVLLTPVDANVDGFLAAR